MVLAFTSFTVFKQFAFRNSGRGYVHGVFRRIENSLVYSGVAVHGGRNTPRFYYLGVCPPKLKPTGVFRRELKRGVLRRPPCIATLI